jgi:hypothetical protein
LEADLDDHGVLRQVWHAITTCELLILFLHDPTPPAPPLNPFNLFRGSLQDVIDRGQFYLDRSDIDKGPKMEAVLATAAEMSQVRR